MPDSRTSDFEVERSAGGRAWRMRPDDEKITQALSQRYDLSDNVARILTIRGVSLESAPTFLDSRLQGLMPDPSSLRDMDKAAARIADAIIGGEQIAIFGDYDVDGATSSALLSRYFSALGHEVQVYIPDRQREGYGPNSAAMDALADAGAQLIITVDCGTMAHAALAGSAARGVDVIVADHHQSGIDLPPVFALVNPRRVDDESGMGHLAAVGVCFLLLVAVQRCLRHRSYFESRPVPDLMSWLDLVALGTVCDVVPLIGFNRALVRQGLRVLNSTANIGLRALSVVSRTGAIGAYELGFLLGPRINAGGRVGESLLGVRLLTTSSEEEARALAVRLDDYNTARKDIEGSVLAAARAQAEALCAQHNRAPNVLVLSGRGWHSGVVGIVASRMKDLFRRPCFVIAIDDDGQGRGSARSLEGVDVGQLVARAVSEGLVTGGGGHAMAAGVSLDEAQIERFSNWLCDQITPSALEEETFWLDAAISPHGATRAFVDDMAQLMPFGVGNPEPRFVLPYVRILNVQLLEAGHVRCVLGDDSGGRLKAMGFASLHEDIRGTLARAVSCHITGYLRPDDWQGRRGVQFIIHDVSVA